MRKVLREDIVDYQTYQEFRAEFQKKILALKEPRRIHLGPNLTFLFENRHTMKYQVQEMMRIERIVKEADILREIQTYNGLLGTEGELACTLMIEIPDEADRKRLLTQWLGLEKKIYMKTESGDRIPANYDESQVGDDRISSVQYLKFKVGAKVPERLGCDFSEYNHEMEFSDAQWKALQEDLQGI